MKYTVKKTVSLILACFMTAAMLAGCGKGNTDKNYVTGLEGAKLALASERLSGELIDRNDSVFDGVASDLRAMASDGRTIMAEAQISAYAENVSYAPLLADGEGSPVLLNTPTHTEIGAWSRTYTQFNDTVRQSVDLANIGADNIDYMKKHVRDVDKWVVSENTRMLLHVEENSELLIYETENFLFVCRRTRNAEGVEQYDILQKNKGDFDYAVRAKYIKHSIYEVMYENPANGRDGKNYLGVLAVRKDGRWDGADIRYYGGNVGDEFTTELSVISDEFCINSSYRPDAEEVSRNIMISAKDRSVDIIRINERGDSASYAINVGAFSGYRGLIIDGRKNGLVLADGTVIRDGERIGDNVSCAFTVFESVAGTEAEMHIYVTAPTAQEQRAIFLDMLRSWGIECREPIDRVMASADSAFELIGNAYSAYTWNGYGLTSKENMYKALAIEAEIFASLTDAVIPFRNAPETEAKGETSDVPSFAKLTDASVNYEIQPDGTVYITSAEAGIEDVTLFSEGEKYRIGFALAAEDGLVHIDVTPTAETVHTGGAFSLACGGVTLSFDGIAAGEYALVMYFESSEGIRSTAPYGFGIVTLAEGSALTSIGADAFSDCAQLAEITYGGTKAQWMGITFGSYAVTDGVRIICTDGVITVIN